MKTSQARELRKIAAINGNSYRLIGFYITGSMKTFYTKREALKYAKDRGWKVTNPLNIKERGSK